MYTGNIDQTIKRLRKYELKIQRAKFAEPAMIGILSNQFSILQIIEVSKKLNVPENPDRDEYTIAKIVAKSAVKYVDALIAELEEEKGETDKSILNDTIDYEKYFKFLNKYPIRTLPGPRKGIVLEILVKGKCAPFSGDNMKQCLDQAIVWSEFEKEKE